VLDEGHVLAFSASVSSDSPSKRPKVSSSPDCLESGGSNFDRDIFKIRVNSPTRASSHPLRDSLSQIRSNNSSLSVVAVRSAEK